MKTKSQRPSREALQVLLMGLVGQHGLHRVVRQLAQAVGDRSLSERSKRLGKVAQKLHDLADDLRDHEE